ncbi:hypothetical protein [Acidisphaera sp. S103]|nr:hypothetical protein [Acidisphaera sp. S103]
MTNLSAPKTGMRQVLGRCKATFADSGNLDNNKSRFVYSADAEEPVN